MNGVREGKAGKKKKKKKKKKWSGRRENKRSKKFGLCVERCLPIQNSVPHGFVCLHRESTIDHQPSTVERAPAWEPILWNDVSVDVLRERRINVVVSGS